MTFMLCCLLTLAWPGNYEHVTFVMMNLISVQSTVVPKARLTVPLAWLLTAWIYRQTVNRQQQTSQTGAVLSTLLCRVLLVDTFYTNAELDLLCRRCWCSNLHHTLMLSVTDPKEPLKTQRSIQSPLLVCTCCPDAETKKACHTYFHCSKIILNALVWSMAVELPWPLTQIHFWTATKV